MSELLYQIREGMEIRDAAGAVIGTVDFVRFGDENPSMPGPQSATVSPAVRQERNTFVDFIAEAFWSDDIPETFRERLLRTGFIRVDAAGLFKRDRYVMPDQIASVTGDRVMLWVGRDELVQRD